MLQIHQNYLFHSLLQAMEIWGEALGEFGSPAALAPPSPTVSNGDVKTVGDVALIRHVLLQGGHLLFSHSMIVGWRNLKSITMSSISFLVSYKQSVYVQEKNNICNLIMWVYTIEVCSVALQLQFFQLVDTRFLSLPCPRSHPRLALVFWLVRLKTNTNISIKAVVFTPLCPAMRVILHLT